MPRYSSSPAAKLPFSPWRGPITHGAWRIPSSTDDAKLPADPAFREAMRAYMRWAVDNVLSYSPEDAVVPTRIGIPRWDWSGLQATPGD